MRLVFFILLIAAVQAQNKYSQKCSSDDDCDPLNTCNTKLGKCYHKDLWPLAGEEWAGTFLVFIMSALSNAGGIGGSSIMIPFLLLLFNFETHMVTPIVQVIILSGSIVAVGMKVRLRHPTRDRPLILYDILMLEVGPMLFGSAVGVFLNIGFPWWLILSIFCIITLCLIIVTFIRGFLLYRKETKVKKISHVNVNSQDTVEIDTLDGDNKNDVIEADDSEKDPVVSRPENQPDNQTSKDSNLIIVEAETGRPIRDIHTELQNIYKFESQWWHPSRVLVVAAIFSWAVVAAFIRGDSNTESIAGWELCTKDFWGFFVGFMISMVLIGLSVSTYLNRRDKLKVSLGYDFDVHDLRWTIKQCATFMFFSFMAGFFSGLAGVGGAVILGPVQLAFGVRPEVSTGTSSCIVILTSTMNFILFLKAGLVTVNYSLWLLAFSVTGSALGVFVVKKLVDKFGRPSIMVFCLGTVYISAFILTMTYNIRKIIKDQEDGKTEYDFKDFC
mmetsp:Transcript_3567/g.3341  ORF Transcript_3567/g.3341 Transcript_3567/m.3341 type:complete len:500 (-) Transcript_3567:344-1843(-)|eukprot:CAMPEP_0202944764 /NCGR_PEP_ID=MMETSP1395-20130829/5649_1 /ASSEMBLY_ACC=CAM_ASM_000871 /TAXON_ID=5961 /ORGANISM="Blepharisma japonicum, Strain Stock R1072" /LENGTH=499 /DNA_ID=CAMNT_0049643975 /DNA_START=85 /DNA_END=1587 /DNA_ORIENTATION=+